MTTETSIPTAALAPARDARAVVAADATPSIARLLTANVAMQLAGMLAGQLFAFYAATHLAAARGAGTGALMVALVGASFGATRLLAMPVAGRLIDLRGAARVLLLSPVLGAAAVTVASLTAVVGVRGVAGAAILVAARMLEGASAACAIPAMLTLLSRATAGRPALRTRVMGGFELSALAGLMGAMLGATVLWERLDTRALLALTPLYLAAIPLLLRRGAAADAVGAPGGALQDEPAPPPIRVALRAMAAQRSHVLFAVVWLAANAMVGLWLQYMPYLLMLGARTPGQRLVGSLTGAGTTAVLAGVGALYVGGTAAWSWFGARVPRRAMLATAVGATVAMSVVLVAVNHGAPRGLHAVTAVCLALQGGITPAALALLADLTAGEDRARGTAMGLFSFLLGVGQFVGVLLGGPLVARFQLDGLLALTCALAVTALAALAAMGTPEHVVYEPGAD